MKTKYSFPILLSMACILLLPACENADLLKSTDTVADNKPILPRGDCDDCQDEDECCCYIELDAASSASIELCGSSDGSTCVGSIPCVTAIPFSNIGHSWTLTSTFPQQDFCMYQNAGFCVRNTGQATTVKISCQRGASMPQDVTVSLPANGRAYFQINEHCEVIPCTE